MSAEDKEGENEVKSAMSPIEAIANVAVVCDITVLMQIQTNANPDRPHVRPARDDGAGLANGCAINTGKCRVVLRPARLCDNIRHPLLEESFCPLRTA
jgi:hypothetical protein